MNNKKKIKSFSYGFVFSFFLKKGWFWFADPFNVKGAAMVNFFSYNNIDKGGFHKKEGLTSIIDLNRGLDDIWGGIRKKFTRSLIKEGGRKGVIIKQDNNFRDFKKIYKNFREKKGINVDKFSMFKNGILFSAYLDGKMVAGHVFIGDGEYIRSWAAASSRLSQGIGKDRRTIGCANRMLIWEAIKYAKDNEYKIFDLGGIAPDSKDKSQRTLAEFKESFGGARRKCYYYYKVYSPLLKLWIKTRKIIKLWN